MDHFYRPTLDPVIIARRLERLLFPGELSDPALDGSIRRARRDFDRYAACYPLPLWAPGLVLTPEMRSLTETLLPVAPLKHAVSRLVAKSLRFSCGLDAASWRLAPTWLDLLERAHPLFTGADPGPLLEKLSRNEMMRRDFLFALFLPKHHGGAFDRYPQQSAWLCQWLKENRKRLKGRIRALDLACGSGEGTWDLLAAVRAQGFGTRSRVHGSTHEPIELFAASHAFFPHDGSRQELYRRRIAPLLDGGGIGFYRDDVASSRGKGGYDLVVCNGLLGGPFLHGEGELKTVVAALARRLRPGGVLLAADRFHEGWRLKVPRELLVRLLSEGGLVPVEVPEGIAGRNG